MNKFDKYCGIIYAVILFPFMAFCFLCISISVGVKSAAIEFKELIKYYIEEFIKNENNT